MEFVFGCAFAQGAAPVEPRGNYLIKNGAVITVDPALGVQLRADIHVNNGRIEAIRPDLAATGAEIIDASDMIVMPGFVDTHHHMWSSIGRSFTADGGFGYFPAKAATSKLYQPKDFYHSVRLGLQTRRRWSATASTFAGECPCKSASRSSKLYR
jgi:5-methylthioadenosine/S-adenosylhomocysteine deaminase